MFLGSRRSRTGPWRSPLDSKRVYTMRLQTAAVSEKVTRPSKWKFRLRDATAIPLIAKGDHTRERCSETVPDFVPRLRRRSCKRRIAAPKENRMQRRMSFWRGVGVLAAVVVLAGVAPASAQTQGMERRGERRNVRAGARAAKQACKAGDEKSRAECRQVKREAKQAGRHHGGHNAQPAPPHTQAQ